MHTVVCGGQTRGSAPLTNRVLWGRIPVFAQLGGWSNCDLKRQLFGLCGCPAACPAASLCQISFLVATPCSNLKSMKFKLLALSIGVFLSVALAFDPLPPIPSTVGLDNAERVIFEATNAERAKAGLKPLKWDTRISAAARLHAKDMAERGFFDHTSTKSGFETPTLRVQKAGALDAGAGENIALNNVKIDLTGAKLMDQWMNSPPHRAAILRPEYTHIGIGVVQGPEGKIFGVQNFVMRELEVLPEVTRQNIKMQRFKLQGRVDAGLEVALFSGRDYLGQLEVDGRGRFSTALDFDAGREYQLSWRKSGSAGNFLIQGWVKLPKSFGAGAVKVDVQNDAPFKEMRGALEAKKEDSHVLELRVSGVSQPVLLFEKIGSGEIRTVAKGGLIRTRCAVTEPKRRFQLGYGGNTYKITHAFRFDCASGQLEAGN